MQNLLYWMRKDEVSDDMIYKRAATSQEIFIRDRICQNLLKVQPFVISSHRSKSIDLPVYAFTMKNGIKVICRDNFYDWGVSIELPQPIGKPNCIPIDLLSRGGSCCEGFKKRQIYPKYDPENTELQKFTVCLSDDYKFYTLMYFLKHLFPEVEYPVETWTKETVIEKLIKINKEQGNYDLYNCQKQYGLEHPSMIPVMRAWELWWNTYHYFDSKVKFIPDPNRKGYIIRDINFDMDTPEDADSFAEFIVNDEEGMKIFQSEVRQYEQTY